MAKRRVPGKGNKISKYKLEDIIDVTHFNKGLYECKLHNNMTQKLSEIHLEYNAYKFVSQYEKWNHLEGKARQDEINNVKRKIDFILNFTY